MSAEQETTRTSVADLVRRAFAKREALDAAREMVRMQSKELDLAEQALAEAFPEVARRVASRYDGGRSLSGPLEEVLIDTPDGPMVVAFSFRDRTNVVRAQARRIERA